jgi:REP element-mobilizing transposase RayT
MTYLITFSCYGDHLHGDERGSVDPNHNHYRTRIIHPDSTRLAKEHADLTHPPYHLDAPRRDIVLNAICEVCAHHSWWLHAVHVRSSHVHVVVEAERPPEFVMNAFKSRASRLLNESNLEPNDRKRWTRHGSTRWLRNPASVSAAVAYVLQEQGAPMSIYEESPP